MTTRRAAKIEKELREIADELEQIQAREAALYEYRLDLWIEGQGRDGDDAPVILTQLALARASRVGEGAVAQALRKHRRESVEA